MSRSFSSIGPVRPVSSASARDAAERLTIGRVAGIVTAMSSLVALCALQLLSNRKVPEAFDLLVLGALLVGLGCLLVPWDRIAAAWLHLLPALATVTVAIGIRLQGTYGEVAASYYVFIVLFAAYAFASRHEVIAHVLLASVASVLPLVYRHQPGSEAGAKTAVGILLLVVVAGIVTVLRERLEGRQRELEELALRDPLTGVGNYRLLTELLEHELARHRRSEGQLTVMLFDLDGFKEINDTFGHLVGDRVLIEVARALSSAVRAQDTVSRQGGDEFSILAPETDELQAATLAARAQQAVADALGGSLTTSAGWVTFPTHAQDADTLLALADAALRRAKQEGGGSRRGRTAGQRGGILRLVEGSAS